MDRQEQIELLLDHYEHPRHRHADEGADVVMPGGNPGCGDVITVYLTVDEDGKSIKDVSFVGEGCTISQAAASILMEMIHDEKWDLDTIVNTDYHAMMDILGAEAVQSRPKCATLALGTLKAAVQKYLRDRMLADARLDAIEAENEEMGIVTGEAALEQADDQAARSH
ncbi:iron-sulfur cluster assembly scaffold protein [Sphaerobacter sp.]|uniref:iron-sulfur cluster assembly scaffold protein n=1 Tax=Sphaerobacter sp. TaxID=2099654 RepID=UPI001DA2D443|nr:iron-sulfur cluster assembly scaffold protein [Sphaerobacter sp.]MBX5445679.1 iron-sulfur cluster assembly scaffold protein [Sphaerobacter sp.]